ncbi:hypothetical protein ANO11243_046350 [Dothideomycetidae sp. 11243]|nr:hypothetical protein ANO11243_046350 [fungal sp. No.11243]
MSSTAITSHTSGASTRMTRTTTVTLQVTSTITVSNSVSTGLSTFVTAIPTQTTALETSVITMPSASPTSSGTEHNTAPTNKAAIAGGVIGSLAAVAVIATVAFMLWKRRRSSSDNQAADQPYEPKKDIKRSERQDFRVL